MNYNGKGLMIDIYGESHSDFVGVKIYGIPKDKQISVQKLQKFIDRRKSTNSFDTPRKEEDKLILVSGIKQGKTDGNIIEFKVKNTNIKPSDYEKIKTIPRPSTADLPAMIKYGENYKTGSGKFSGRMTLPICIAGGIAIQILQNMGIEINSHILSIGKIKNKKADEISGKITDKKSFLVKTKKEIIKAKRKGDSLGGTIECVINGLPVGLGDCLFDGLESQISNVVFGIPSVKGIEFGSGFYGATLSGKKNNDDIIIENGKIKTKTNNAGGILGGMSNGMPLIFSVAFKPVPSISKSQDTIDFKSKKNIKLNLISRSDSCILFRATPIVESAGAIAILSTLLFQQNELTIENIRNKIDFTDFFILSLLEKRLEYVKKIGEIKRKEKRNILDANREKEIIKNLANSFPDLKELLTEIYPKIFEFSKGQEK